MSKNRYSTEFKKEAAPLIIIEGMSVSPAQFYKCCSDAPFEST
jgi:hypothetical protein